MANYLFLLAFTVLLCSSCNSDDGTPENCGCDAETQYTLPNEEFEEIYGITPEKQTTGLLYYKHTEIVDGYADHVEEFRNKFWIFQGTEGCGNCRRVFIVCNDDLVGEEFTYLKKEGVYDSIAVKFFGDVKSDSECVEPFIALADMYYATIKLNRIELK
ncbi:hypothetical protein [Formosa sp. A9]|uniref:hypothetical protein n=1 Tax=Formosa sp. A9 TaxID=3442641 RepID=UPI003EBB64C0